MMLRQEPHNTHQNPPPVHICIRQTLDWHDAAVVKDRILPRFRQKFEMWDRTFTMPYNVFRQRLKAITLANLRRVDGATLSAIDDVPQGDLIVPIDDDDWFAPHLVDVVRRSHNSDATGYLWQRETLEHRTRYAKFRARAGRLVGHRDRHTCTTNNYAVRNQPDLAPLALNHLRASTYFDGHASQIQRIPETLGIQNRSLASQTSLAFGRPAISRRELVALFERYRGLYCDWRPAAALEWAVPYVERMHQLMRELNVRS